MADESFSGYPPLIALHVLLFAFLGWAAFESTHPGEERPRWRRYGSAAIGLVGFLVAHVANGRVQWGAYPTLHVSVLQSSALLLAVGFTGLLLGRRPRPTLWALAGTALVAGPALVATGWSDPLRPRFLDQTVLGVGLLEGEADPEPEAVTSPEAGAPDERAAARFAEHSGLPALPDSFRTTDYDVLWITGEATRFDLSSFGDPSEDATPRLKAWVEESGAFVFDRAYSPGCGTLQSLSAAHSMVWTTAAPVDVRRKAWLGRLRAEAQTVAETFAAAGYDTAWLGHNLRKHFTKDIRGFEQGFGRTDLVVPEGKAAAEVDRLIADRVVADLKAPREGRSFRWVFFASPHSPYRDHDPERPAKTDKQRYLQELRYMDGQIGRVLDALHETGLHKRTIVFFFGDHGEAFREHGTRYHMRTVHAEVNHVPLLVRIPGLEGGVRQAPTSTSYVFPWLLQRGDDGMRSVADTRLRKEIGPLMRAIDGAVLTELVSPQKMRVRFTDPRYATLYDVKSKRLEIYDHRADLAEKDDLAPDHPDLVETARARIERYRATRAALQRLKLATKKAKKSVRSRPTARRRRR